MSSSSSASSLEGVKDNILDILSNVWQVVYTVAFDYKIIISIVAILLLLASRIVIANTIRVHRTDKRDWIFWGIMVFLQLVNTLFINWKPFWLIAQITILFVMFMYIYIVDSSREVRTTIYSSNIIYEDNSNKYDNNDREGSAELEKARKAKDGKITRRWTRSRMQFAMGHMPVLMTKFIFRISPMATPEQIGKCVSQLNKYYDSYNWRQVKQTNGTKYEINAELKVNKVLSIPFDKELSDELDWYVLPLGAIDVSNKQTVKESPYVWMLHDPKTEGKSYKSLAKTKLYTPSPQGFIVGSTGGGKSVLINTMIAHLINKAKTERQANLYLCDAKRVEFAPYACLEEVEGCAFTLEEAVDLSNKFVEEMLQRNEMMSNEAMKKIPLDGKVHLEKSININGHIIKNTEVIEYKTADGKIHKDYALNLKDKTDIIEVNIPEMKNDDDDDDSGSRW